MGGIIWLASYPKSGNTWTRAFLHNLLTNPAQPVDVNELDKFTLGESARSWYERHATKPLESMTLDEIVALRAQVHRDFTRVSPDSVFVKTHNFLGERGGHPIHNMDVTAGAIYIVRNPLDVVISMTHHFGLSVDEAIDMMNNPLADTDLTERHVPQILSTWSTHVTSWAREERPGLHIMRYEDMLEKPLKTFGKLTRFLGLNPSKERLQKAIRFSSFRVLKEQEKARGFKERSAVAKSFFREGTRDQWRKLLTPEQVQRIVDDHGEQMARFGYVPKVIPKQGAA
ncbi:MAG: sulfotransferase domain-containing protein [Alphaproteobacteria bacterium]|nr:sulfotransferase domain-containing protein [Alphaproteobacteria bacterium]MDX5369341.1 sulfotransferase domain-containing protein [Alphaproteobacteria bacterium]MDX5464022.1 sulfotransferase domain-containing protein [Alphaproteobacteria bacterium]